MEQFKQNVSTLGRSAYSTRIYLRGHGRKFKVSKGESEGSDRN